VLSVICESTIFRRMFRSAAPLELRGARGGDSAGGCTLAMGKGAALDAL
jgi:hypothetical protein